MKVGRSDGCQPPLLHQLDNNKLAERCAIDGVVKKDATSPQHARDVAYHGVPGSNVLQHIAAIDNVERLVFERQVVAVSRAIIEYQSLLSRMTPRCVERRLGSAGEGWEGGCGCAAVEAPRKAIPATTTRITRMNAATSSR